jgi:hypothetical protein
MNRKQQKTLVAIFAAPAPKTLPWADIESLLLAIGCKIIVGDGSRVRFIKDDMMIYFHRPHPQKEVHQYQVKAAKEYLIKLGVTP